MKLALGCNGGRYFFSESISCLLVGFHDALPVRLCPHLGQESVRGGVEALDQRKYGKIEG